MQVYALVGVAAMLAANCRVPLTSVLLLFELTRGAHLDIVLQRRCDGSSVMDRPCHLGADARCKPQCLSCRLLHHHSEPAVGWPKFLGGAVCTAGPFLPGLLYSRLHGRLFAAWSLAQVFRGSCQHTSASRMAAIHPGKQQARIAVSLNPTALCMQMPGQTRARPLRCATPCRCWALPASFPR